MTSPATSQPPARAPLSYCIAAILTSWLGLLAAGLNLRWSATPATQDSLRFSWLYVNIMLGFLWLLIWPAAALRRLPRSQERSAVFWQWLALATGAIPAVWVSRFLSGIPAPTVVVALWAQFALSAFAAAIIAVAHRLARPSARAWAAIILAAPATAGPVALFICSNFFPRDSAAWSIALPPVLVARAALSAPPISLSAPAPIAAAIYLALALLLLLFPALRK